MKDSPPACSRVCPAEDYMFADLAVDPSRCGCQSFEASDFLICGRIFDPTAVLSSGKSVPSVIVTSDSTSRKFVVGCNYSWNGSFLRTGRNIW